MASFIHIVAMSKNGYIGIGDKLPFDLPEDLLNFKALTADSLICMGFNTFKSIADNYVKAGKPFLPGRQITVICSTTQLALDRTKQYAAFDNVLFLVSNVFNQLASRNRKPIIIVGGSRLYAQYRPSLIIATHVDQDVVVPSTVPTTPVPPAGTVTPVPLVKYHKYPYFDDLDKNYFGLSLAPVKSATGLEYNYTIYTGNF